MRILSQDGLHEGIIDVPYEQVSIEQKENEIWCGYSSTMDRNCVGKCFAKYSTEEKAIKAMEMLHGAYCGEIYMKCGDYEVADIDLSQELEKKIREEMSKAKFLTTIPNPVIECKIFQFPKDSEIEV